MMLNVVKTLLPGIISFALGIGFAPLLTNFLYKHKMWKKRAGKRALDGGETPIFNKLHETREVGVPKMGGALFLGALVGLAEDFLEGRATGSHIAGGLSLRKRLIAVALISLFAAVWFFVKLDVNTVSLPFLGEIGLGTFFIPLFVIIALAVYSGGVIDGIDGLAGGVFAIMFGAYSLIAFFQAQFNLAAFCAAIVGGIL